jgi:hypothetical protein
LISHTLPTIEPCCHHAEIQHSVCFDIEDIAPSARANYATAYLAQMLDANVRFIQPTPES